MKGSRWITALALGAIGAALWGQSITVQSPKAGDEWCIGGIYHVIWIKSGTMPDTVKIRLRRAGAPETEASVWAITDSTANDGDFGPLTVPTSVPAGNYFIRVRTIGDPDVIGDSTVFQVKSCAPLPDLLIEEAWTTPKHPDHGDLVEFRARLRNVGQSATGSAFRSEIAVAGPEGFQPIQKGFRVPPLAAGEAHEIFFRYRCSHWGIMAVTVRLDINPEIDEADEENNTKKKLHIVNPLPDLLACIQTGVSTNIQTKKKIWATVVNRGNLESRPCRMRWYVEQNGPVYRDIPRLNPGEEKLFYREVRFSTRGKKNMETIADCDNEVKEFKEDNNKVQGTARIFLHTEFNTAGLPIKKCAGDAD